EQKDGEITPHFQPMILQFLACPLSEKTLRCEESTDELINEYGVNQYVGRKTVSTLTVHIALVFQQDNSIRSLKENFLQQ
ncbi:hypothetical protein EI555_014280, partial [Monodon monoceros]